MPTSVRSYGKINLGLHIGPPEFRADGFHELRTVYQTIALHDVVRVSAKDGMGIEIRCSNPRVPPDESNTCWKTADRILKSLKVRKRVLITIEKNLPLQGGLGAASGNAAATMLGLERELRVKLPLLDRLRIAEEVGSDVPLFLIGGTVLGTGRGEQVWPLPELPALPIVVATHRTGVSTPKAFKDWDGLFPSEKRSAARSSGKSAGKLTVSEQIGRLDGFSRELCSFMAPELFGTPSGVPAKSGDRAEALLLDLVRTGIENDFERVVFTQIPELREVKRAVERTGARFTSLSGSGSSIFGLYDSSSAAAQAAAQLNARDIPARETTTLPRSEYWRTLFE